MILAACIGTSVGCYPAYPPPGPDTVYQPDSKGYEIPQDPVPQPGPRYAGVDPGLAIAGVAAAGLLGYALGNNHGYHHHSYYGPRFYRPVPYYYGPRFYR